MPMRSARSNQSAHMAVDSSTLREAITATARAMNALRINRGKSGNVSASVMQRSVRGFGSIT